MNSAKIALAEGSTPPYRFVDGPLRHTDLQAEYRCSRPIREFAPTETKTRLNRYNRVRAGTANAKDRALFVRYLVPKTSASGLRKRGGARR